MFTTLLLGIIILILICIIIWLSTSIKNWTYNSEVLCRLNEIEKILNIGDFK